MSRRRNKSKLIVRTGSRKEVTRAEDLAAERLLAALAARCLLCNVVGHGLGGPQLQQSTEGVLPASENGATENPNQGEV